MDNSLSYFTQSTEMFDAVETFLQDYLKTRAGEMAVMGESVVGVKEAKMFIESAFNELKAIYEIRKPTKVQTNEAH